MRLTSHMGERKKYFWNCVKKDQYRNHGSSFRRDRSNARCIWVLFFGWSNQIRYFFNSSFYTKVISLKIANDRQLGNLIQLVHISSAEKLKVIDNSLTPCRRSWILLWRSWIHLQFKLGWTFANISTTIFAWLVTAVDSFIVCRDVYDFKFESSSAAANRL